MEESLVVQVVAKKKNEVWGWIRFSLLMVLLFLVIHNVVGITKVSGNSMNPSLQNGNILLMNKLPLFYTSPKYGDVVVIQDERLGFSIIKRVIGVQGDHILITDGVIYVNGNPLAELYTVGESEDMKEQIVTSGHLFVVGDNRNLGESKDSRDPSLGQVQLKDVRGYAAISLFPVHRISMPLDLN